MIDRQPQLCEFLNTEYLINSRGHSQLYCLEPINKGKAMIESINGYVIRLAEVHCVTPQDLVMYEVFPLFGIDCFLSKNKRKASSYILEHMHRLNGMARSAQSWIDTIEELTMRNDLRSCTLLPWADFFNTIGVLKNMRSWCPYCYQEWFDAGRVIYEPLIWSVGGVDVCIYHKRLLDSECYKCRRTMLTFNANARIGHCSLCGQWLGLSSAIEITNHSIINNLEYHTWCSNAIHGMFDFVLNYPKNLDFKDIPLMIGQILESKSEFIGLLSQRMNISTTTLRNLFQSRSRPSLNTFIELCFNFDVDPVDIISGRKKVDLNEVRVKFALDRSEIDRINKIFQGRFLEYGRNGDFKYNKDVIEEYMNTIISEKVYPMPCIKDISVFIGCSRTFLKENFARSCKEITAIRFGVDDRKNLKSTIDLIVEERPAPSLLSVCKRIERAYSWVVLNFPDQSKVIVENFRNRMLSDEVRLMVKEALLLETPISLKQLSRNIGIEAHSLRVHYSKECSLLVDRRKEYVQNRKIDNLNKGILDIKDAIKTLYAQGVYPSSCKVSEILNDNGKTVLGYVKEHMIWREAMIEMDLL